MGFGDILKKAQNIGTGIVSSAVEKGKALAEKGAEEKAKELGDIKSFGFIEWDGLEKPANGGSIDFNIDADNDKLIVFRKNIGMFKIKCTLVTEFLISDVVDFKIYKVDRKDNKERTWTSYYGSLLLKSGDILRIYYSNYVYKTFTYKHQFSEESSGLFSTLTVITTFIFQINDEKTKEYINQFFIENGAKAPFDENGVTDYKIFFKLQDEIIERRTKEWDEKIKTITDA